MTSTILFFIIYIFYINCFPLNGNLTNIINNLSTIVAQNTHGKSMRYFFHVPPSTNNIYWIAFNIPTGVNALTLESMDITGSHNSTNFIVKETYVYGLSAVIRLYTTENIGNRVVSFVVRVG